LGKAALTGGRINKNNAAAEPVKRGNEAAETGADVNAGGKFIPSQERCESDCLGLLFITPLSPILGVGVLGVVVVMSHNKMRLIIPIRKEID